MADISKLKTPDGTTYSLKDETARAGLAGKAAASHTHSDYMKKLQRVGDWNDVSDVGWFIGNNAANAPTQYAQYVGYISIYVQELYPVATFDPSIPISPYKYVRYKTNDGWSSWEQVCFMTTTEKSNIRSLMQSITNKADASHTHTKSQITDLPAISNPNLLINPDFKINQRGISGTFSEVGKYFVDRWKLVSGSVTINADGTLTLSGSICQLFENAVGADVTASVSAGTAVYDDATKTFTITGNGDVISWAKLEYGNVATQFIPPNSVTELMKCQRYYTTGEYAFDKTTKNFNYAVIAIRFPVKMRITPTFIIYSHIGTVNTISYWASRNEAINDVYANGLDISPHGLKSITSANSFSEGESYIFKYIADAEIY